MKITDVDKIVKTELTTCYTRNVIYNENMQDNQILVIVVIKNCSHYMPIFTEIVVILFKKFDTT